MINSDVAPVVVDTSKDKADDSLVKAKVNAPLIVTSPPSKGDLGLPDYAKFKGAPGVEASRGQIFNPAAKEFVPSQSKTESSSSNSPEAKAPLTVKEEPSEIQREATLTTAPTGPQEVAVTVPTTQIEEPKAEAIDNNVAPQAIAAQATAAQTRLTVNRNPHFAAEVKGATYDKEEAQTKLVEDIDRSERDGDLETLCIVCDKPSTQLCNGCKHAKYCSRKCQVADWPLHKKVCADFAGAAAEAKRPSPEHRRILFFPTFSTKPELLWAVHHETDDNEWLEFDHPDLALFCKKAEVESLPGKRKGHSVLNLMNILGKRRIGHMLTAITWTVSKPTSNPLQPRLVNQSINALSKPGYLRPWFGPVSCFADARHPGEPVPPKIRDVTARDVHSLVRLIECCDSTCVDKPELYYGEIISGLRISDVRTEINVGMGVKHVFDVTNVPIRPVNSSDYVIAMAFHLGLRWYIRPGNFMGLRSDVTFWSDGNLRYLGYVCAVHEVVPDSDQQGSSSAPPPPRLETVFNFGPFASSVLVLHGSGNPVLVDHVLAFNAYLDEVYVKKGVASKDEFKKFWAAYKTAGGGPLSSVPSPYKWEKANVVDRLGFFDPAIVMDKVQGNIRDVWMNVVDMLNGLNAEIFEICKRKGKTRG
ncbi:hypothetical protein C8A01DRAFT_12841 [Parachaetomium inaequale]|uniref:MYND-type domain-containing protein n=1 Tax=Parachaetomium inaequale TaxID=2588326 RepID=A0AAN6SVI3_9PEZI|nr:hypothetical protein C8A01DRAFT_12841 [Parachaetomium inaequale]